MLESLTPQQLRSAPAASGLELDQIQGDVLIGLQKFFELFLFFEVRDVAAFKAALKSRITHFITTAEDVHSREFELRDHKAQGQKTPLPLTGVNLGFSADGLRKLLPNADLGDASFAKGARKQAQALGDPVDAGGNPTTWVAKFAQSSIDGVFLITGGTADAVAGLRQRVLDALGAAIAVSYEETGAVRPGTEKGHEHFGWLDGVSQPAIKGLSDPFPGQAVLDAGLFVFGYPGGPAVLPQPWMKNGAFMVLRRLKQLVPEFDQFLLDAGAKLGLDPVLLGARLVGRWKSGAPLEFTPSQDDMTLGPDPQRNNNFDFSDDPAQRRCPFGAHIRKTNPREDFPPPSTEESAVNPHRIMRAGIPFGPEVTTDEADAHQTKQDRGLMFVCYQTSIPNQFEFVQIKWANNSGFIFGKTNLDGTPVQVGWDPLIGQNPAPGRARNMDEPVPNYPTGNVRSKVDLPQDFIIPTAAAYFLMPSIAALQDALSA